VRDNHLNATPAPLSFCACARAASGQLCCIGPFCGRNDSKFWLELFKTLDKSWSEDPGSSISRISWSMRRAAWGGVRRRTITSSPMSSCSSSDWSHAATRVARARATAPRS
jgi:hypothetical protein